MKNLFKMSLLVGIGTIIILSGHAQTTNTFPNDGNVGIGTLSPIKKLDVYTPASTWKASFRGPDGYINIGPASSSAAHIYTDRPFFLFNHDIRTLTNGFSSYNSNLSLQTIGVERISISSANGNVGIGTSSPSHKLLIATGNVLIKGLDGHNAPGEEAILYLGDDNNFIKSVHSGGLILGTYCWDAPYYVNAIYINHCGNVGIGTSDPGSNQLAVEGYIGARGVRVTSNTPFPDYVFDDEYPLISIYELANYIRIHKHLPEIPSKDEVKESKGVDLGELQLLLLKKLEEQALYIIDLQKQIDDLNNKLSD